MYDKTRGNQELLDLVRQMNEKIDKLQCAMEKQDETPTRIENVKNDVTENNSEKSGDEDGAAIQNISDNVMWNLTQMQYELSGEMLTGLKKLKQAIHESEKQTTLAKREYQK